MYGSGGAYGAWADFLDRFAAGENADPSRLPALKPEDFPPDGWERFGRRLNEAVNDRMNGWAKNLVRAMGESRDEFGVGRALTQARDGARVVRALGRHPGLPPGLGDKLLRVIDSQIRQAQTDLEDGVEQDRRAGLPPRAVEARLRTLRDNPLTAVLAEDVGAAAPVAAPTAATGSAPRRRLTFD